MEKKGADPNRRAAYDQGGRHPLTRERIVPIVVIVDWPLWEEIDEAVNDFINPVTRKPYGISAVCRILVKFGIMQIDRLTARDILDYIPVTAKGSTGRNPLSDEGQVKLSIALRQEDILAINKQVSRINHALVGTTSIVRWILRDQLKNFEVGKLYLTIPEKHKNHMLELGLTIKDLQSQWRKRRKK